MKGTKIVVTYNCNIMCSHCAYKCGPHRRGTMSVDDFMRAAVNSYNGDCNEYISIAGGEPFLHSGIVYKYLKSISILNLKKNIITNGYWGNIEPYIEILAGFKEIGLNGIIIEYDYFHSFFINTSTIKNAIDKCIKTGLNVTVKSYFITNNMTDSRDIETFKYIKAIRNENEKINLMFEVLGDNANRKFSGKGKEDIILYK